MAGMNNTAPVEGRRVLSEKRKSQSPSMNRMSLSVMKRLVSSVLSRSSMLTPKISLMSGSISEKEMAFTEPPSGRMTSKNVRFFLLQTFFSL